MSPNDSLIGGYASFALANAHFVAGRYAKCVVQARNTIERSPELVPAHVLLVAATAMQGHREEAAEACAGLLRLRPDALAWTSANWPYTHEPLERLLEGLRRAGVP